jgi:hypothetical protein
VSEPNRLIGRAGEAETPSPEKKLNAPVCLGSQGQQSVNWQAFGDLAAGPDWELVNLHKLKTL